MNPEKLIIKIDEMTTADVDGIFEIEKASYGEHHWSKDSFYSELSNNLARYFCDIFNSFYYADIIPHFPEKVKTLTQNL